MKYLIQLSLILTLLGCSDKIKELPIYKQTLIENEVYELRFRLRSFHSYKKSSYVILEGKEEIEEFFSNYSFELKEILLHPNIDYQKFNLLFYVVDQGSIGPSHSIKNFKSKNDTLLFDVRFDLGNWAIHQRVPYYLFLLVDKKYTVALVEVNYFTQEGEKLDRTRNDVLKLYR